MAPKSENISGAITNQEIKQDARVIELSGEDTMS
jgi:hypothetical protein